MENLGLRWRQMRFNPLRSLTPVRLANALDSHAAGWVREAALIFETIEKREAIVKSVMGKRKAAVARRDWQVITPDPEHPLADAHKATLDYFYENLTVTDATDGNVRCGVSGLLRQMMDAVLQGYAVHEIVWQPGPGGLTAELRRVPLYFFENRSGKLRFIGPETRADGLDLADDGWMVTVADGLGEALAICYMFKRMGIQDLMAFSEKFSVPGVLGRTSAAADSKEGRAMADAVLRYASEWVGVIHGDDGVMKDPISIIQTPGGANLPPMVIAEYFDRMIATLVRGGDLSTISREGESSGSNRQAEEGDTLLEDDCAMVSETLQTQLDRLVIRMVHGDERPAAYMVVNPPSSEDLTKDLAIDSGLVALGVVQDPADLAERYGREVRSEKLEVRSEEVENARGDLTDPAAPTDEVDELRAVLTADLKPLGDALAAALEAEDYPAMQGALRKISAGMPELAGDVAGLTEALAGKFLGAFLGEEQLANGDFMGHPFRGNQWGGDWKSHGLLPASKVTADPGYARIKAYQAAARLIAEETVTDDQGRPVKFTAALLDHWSSKPRAEQQQRLTELDDATNAVRNPHEVWSKGGQTIYLRKYTGNGPTRWMAVFVPKDTTKTYFSSDRTNKADDLFRQGSLLRKR